MQRPTPDSRWNPSIGSQLHDIAHEPQGIYHILGSLKVSLENEDTSDGILWATQSENTNALLEICQMTTTEIEEKISIWKGRQSDSKDAEQAVMSRDEVSRYRQAKKSQKSSLGIAISLASL
ncbi:hypothetical protein F53441_7953 [Fusarium austroafricanum]|uniref:Uncharacterized protein n=1 Tax=Fusarium austroafricanum TaxID=2364996 RepID=A0A8H4KFB0_9HYPO|nr:hypothetical protein F53441_7953 [Fusarium austroafricanum]